MQRTFQFDFPVGKFPDLLERVRGTPARLEDRLKGLSRETLTRRRSTGGWSIQENLGHLIDLGYLPLQRIDEILSGVATLVPADMSNRKTNEANHNARDLASLLADFRRDRAKLVRRLESIPEADWGKSSVHPRLKIPMRIVDVAYFDSEHDDYHLGSIGELIRLFA